MDSSTCNIRSVWATVIATFSMFGLFWAQVRALHLSHYAGKGMDPWFVFCDNLRLSTDGQHGRRPARLRRVKYWLIKAVLPLVDPYVSLTLAAINASNAAQMEQSLKKVMKEEKLNLGEGKVAEGGTVLFDPRSVRVLAGAQVYLALPDGSHVNQEIQRIKVKNMEEISPNQKYPEGIPPLEIFPNMLIISPPIVENMSYSRNPRRILLNKAGKEALLKLGFVPDYACLRKLKHISNFEVIISSSNALGFLLNFGVRVLYKHLPISPLESLATFVAIFICFNALAQAVTGSTCLCKQTLLIHLTPIQLDSVISTGRQIKLKNKDRPEKATSNSKKWRQVIYSNRYRVLSFLLYILFLVACLIGGFIIGENKIYLRALELECSQCNWPVYMMVYINFGIFVIVSSLSLLSSLGTLGVSGLIKKQISGIWLIVSSIVMVSAVLLAVSLTFIKWTSLGFDQMEVQHGGGVWYTYLIPHIST